MFERKPKSWFADFRWAMNMMYAKRFRDQIGFAERVRFDAALRPRIVTDYGNGMASGTVIAYPDAPYHITVDDVIRAMHAAANPPVETAESTGNAGVAASK